MNREEQIAFEARMALDHLLAGRIGSVREALERIIRATEKTQVVDDKIVKDLSN